MQRKIKLPANVEDAIEKDKDWEDAMTELSPRHTEAIPSQILFLDSIAKEIGCSMPIWQLMKKPRLLVRHWFYPFSPASYRLVGPHARYDEALEELMTLQPGPLNTNAFVALVSILAMLPDFTYPTDVNFPGPKPGRSRASGRKISLPGDRVSPHPVESG